MIKVNTTAIVSVQLRDASGVLTDPANIVFNVKKPSGDTEVIVSTDSQVQQASTGSYTLTLLVDQAGLWQVNIQTTNPTASRTLSLYASDTWN
jgi:hypothetical protein